MGDGKEMSNKTGRLVSSMMKIGLIGFGGGNALIPVIAQKAVQEEKLLTQEEYEKDIVVASITPGALPVELAGGIGRRTLGGGGMLLGAFSMAFPGVLLTLLALSSMETISGPLMHQISFLALGVSAFIACLLSDYVMQSFRMAVKQDTIKETVLIFSLVVLLTCEKNLYRILGVDASPVFGLATSYIFAMAFFLVFFTQGKLTLWKGLVAFGLCAAYIASVGKGRLLAGEMARDAVELTMIALSLWGAWRNLRWSQFAQAFNFRGFLVDLAWLTAALFAAFFAACWIVPLDALTLYLENGVLSSLMSFGGGDAYLTVADGLFVNTGLVTEEDFYGRLVPLVNLLPGSILCKTLSGIGYYIGFNAGGALTGWIAAATGFAASLFASCGIFSFVGSLYGGVERLEIFRLIRRWIRPIVSGLMVTVILSLVYQSCKLGMSMGHRSLTAGTMAALYGLGMYLIYRRGMKNGRAVALLASLAAMFCNLIEDFG